jgi:energy-coupling factor transporter ATP-binding protein EcfA2
MRNSASRADNRRHRAVPQAPAEAGSWAKADMVARRRALQDLFVQRAPTAALGELIDKVRADRDALSEPTCILITGDTGVGKSTFLKHYAVQHPSRREAGCLVQPVIYDELQSKTTILAAAKALLRKLEDPSRGKGGLADLTYRVIHQLRAQRVEVVLLDEFQHIVETGDITVNEVADWLKQVAKAANVPFVMAGMPTAARIIQGHDQFAGITPYRHTLDQFDWSSQKGRGAFREFPALVDTMLPFDGVAGLADKEWAKALFDATGGRLRPLMRLIKQAALHALDRGSANVGQSDLAYGYEQINPADPKADNPFGSYSSARAA